MCESTNDSMFEIRVCSASFQENKKPTTLPLTPDSSYDFLFYVDHVLGLGSTLGISSGRVGAKPTPALRIEADTTLPAVQFGLVSNPKLEATNFWGTPHPPHVEGWALHYPQRHTATTSLSRPMSQGLGPCDCLFASGILP